MLEAYFFLPLVGSAIACCGHTLLVIPFPSRHSRVARPGMTGKFPRKGGEDGAAIIANVVNVQRSFTNALIATRLFCFAPEQKGRCSEFSI